MGELGTTAIYLSALLGVGVTMVVFDVWQVNRRLNGRGQASARYDILLRNRRRRDGGPVVIDGFAVTVAEMGVMVLIMGAVQAIQTLPPRSASY